MEVEIVQSGSNRPITTLRELDPGTSIIEIKKQVHRIKPKLYPDRQSLKSEPKGKSLRDGDTLQGINFKSGGQIFLKDLGPQIGWKTVTGMFTLENKGKWKKWTFCLVPSFSFFRSVALNNHFTEKCSMHAYFNFKKEICT